MDLELNIERRTHANSDTLTCIVNVDQSNPLVYDFYNFPAHFYQQTFESHGSEDLIGSIKSALKSSHIDVEETKRGLDHGVWGMSCVVSFVQTLPCRLRIVVSFLQS